MSDVVLLMISIAFVLVALLAAVTTLSAPLTAKPIADGVIYGCCVAALVSILMAAWSGFWQPAYSHMIGTSISSSYQASKPLPQR